MKPSTMSDKEYICRVMALKMNIPFQTIEKVMDHSFSSIRENMKTNNSLEIAGFGRFIFNHKKASKRLEELKLIISHIEKKLESSPEDVKLQFKYKTTVEAKNQLEQRLCLN